MKGDFSKNSFDAKKHFRDVLMQQGRVLLDTDWNEQVDITHHRIETETVDVIGESGAPMQHAGFELQAIEDKKTIEKTGENISISKGRYYVDGILCENEEDILFTSQPDYKGQKLPAKDGLYTFYLDVWQRHITALEDPAIREVALGGPDTTTRSQTIWQVKCVEEDSRVVCSTPLPFKATTGLMHARTELSAGDKDPCGLVTSGGYKRLENQLYRVEIHRGGDKLADTTIKWSRDNGSVLAKWESQDAADPKNLVVSSIGRDELLSFKSGNWIELTDDDTDLLNKPGVMVQIASVNGNVITINPSTIADPDNAAATKVTRSIKNPRIRRWDSDGELKIKADTWTALEDGIEVNFKAGSYNTGDYWLIPARTVIANIEWPYTTHQPPKGIQHHYAKLGIFKFSDKLWKRVSDCRNIFPALTDLVALHYVGGDGQEAMPGKALPAALKVGVANGKWAVKGARIKFEILSGGGTLNPSTGIVVTKDTGIAECAWTLGTSTADLHLQVKATLLGDGSNELPDVLPVIFNASFSIANNVAFTPTCNNWESAAPPTNVADALNQLCERKSGGGTSCSFTIGEKGDFKTLEEAIEILGKKNPEYVKLCFMPGPHTIKKDINMEEAKLSFKMLTITGYSAVITMEADRLQFNCVQLVLEGLFISAPSAQGRTNSKTIAIDSGEFVMHQCTFGRGGLAGVPFISITKAALVYISNNKITANIALALANGTQGVIEKNVITNILLQQGNTKTYEPAPMGWASAEIKKNITETLKKEQAKEITLTDWSLTIINNRVANIITDTNRPKPHDVYQNMVIAENIIQGFGNSFAAQFLNLTNNQFTFNDDKATVPATICFMVGLQVIVTGNSNVIHTLATTGGQFSNVVDVIALKAIRGSGIVTQQIMNILTVNG
ncbi:MAG TPA: DUF6519 domain-containing protein [Flavipsychrobacter sp.]|nr:DUF6519 domain-containing protein [Flavipsychrobacter sp.]